MPLDRSYIIVTSWGSRSAVSRQNWTARKGRKFLANWATRCPIAKRRRLTFRQKTFGLGRIPEIDLGRMQKPRCLLFVFGHRQQYIADCVCGTGIRIGAANTAILFADIFATPSA